MFGLPKEPDEWNLEDKTHIFQIPLIGSLGDPKNNVLEPFYLSKNALISWFGDPIGSG